MHAECNVIGKVHNSVNEQTDTDWGKVISEVVLEESLRPGLKGLEDFSHVLILTYLDQASFQREKHLFRRPQGREDMPIVGIFSQRAKDRPNPIGVTACEIIKIERDVLFVRGLDAINGTPVLDIKPYYPIYDQKNAEVPTWVDILMQEYF